MEKLQIGPRCGWMDRKGDGTGNGERMMGIFEFEGFGCLCFCGKD